MSDENETPPAGRPRAEGKPTHGNGSTPDGATQAGLDPAFCLDPALAEAIRRMKALGLADPKIRAALAANRVPSILKKLDMIGRGSFSREEIAHYLLNVLDDEPEQENAAKRNGTEILSIAPETIRRPLCLCGGHAYAASWPWVRRTIHFTTDPKSGKAQTHDPPIVRNEQAMMIVRDDGKLFTDAAIVGAEGLSALGVEVNLPEIPQSSRLWSGAGVSRYVAGERPDPADVFMRVQSVVSRFMDFKRSLGDQETMAELTAAFVVASYTLDAFHVAPYLWPNGDRGAGKTHFLFTVSELAYLGAVILAGGSYASLRDLADYGACIAFDDCENIMDPRKSDPDKRTLLLAGNRRGATVTFKEPAGKRGWVTRHVHTFCPRMFSAIRLPDPVLASRTITIPLVRSIDDSRAKADPLDKKAWPCDRQQLIDDLWATGLSRLAEVRGFDDGAASRARLTGRDLEPWRAILGVSLWLQEKHGVGGLFSRMEELSVSYQKERADIETADPTRLLIRALARMIGVSGVSGVSAFTFLTSALAETINILAVEDEVVGGPTETFTNSKRVGRLLQRLRFEKATPGKTRRKWKVTGVSLQALAQSYGMSLTQDPPTQTHNAENAALAEMPTGTPVVSDDDIREVAL